jgi:RNA polymerase sporulation-specific sigma factor
MNTKTYKIVKDEKENNKWVDANSNLKKKWNSINTLHKSAVSSNDKKLIEKYHNELDAIGSEFYILNQGLAYNLAKSFFINGDERSNDYIQAAALGLWEAFLKWDPDNRASFSTFSRAYIKGRTQRAVRSDEFSHLTQNDFAKRRDVLVAKDQLSKLLGRDPQIAEIAKHVKITNELAERIVTGSNISLFTKIGEDGTLEDLISEKADKNNDMSILFDNADFENIYEELSELELWVLSQRLETLGGDYSRSLLEIGEDIGVGREIARRAETRARIMVATHYLSTKLERVPSIEEISKLSGVEKSKIPALAKVSFTDLYSRLERRLSSKSSDKSSWFRFGYDFIIAIYPHLLFIKDKYGNSNDTSTLDNEDLLLFFYDSFLEWAGNEEVTFPSYIRKSIDQIYSKNRKINASNDFSEAKPNYTQIEDFWSFILINRIALKSKIKY